MYNMAFKMDSFWHHITKLVKEYGIRVCNLLFQFSLMPQHVFETVGCVIEYKPTTVACHDCKIFRAELPFSQTSYWIIPYLEMFRNGQNFRKTASLLCSPGIFDACLVEVERMVTF